MATGVGLRIADDECVAAIATDSGAEGDLPEGEPHYIVRTCVLHMSDDGDAALGGEPPEGYTHSIRHFVGAIGDPNGVTVDDGEAYRAEDLVATALFCLINLSADYLVGPAEFYATHPNSWPPEHVQGLREALDYLGLRSVVLVDEEDLPPAAGLDRGRTLAHHAARSALAAVLATPAGTTPPDPSEPPVHALEVTDVIPSVDAAGARPQAYSAAMPAADPLVTEPGGEPGKPAATPATVPPARPEHRTRNRIVLLIAAAVALGTVLGGIGMAVIFRESSDPKVPPLPDAQSSLPPVTSTTAPVPPPPLPLGDEPPVVITTTTTDPEPTPEPPPPPPTSEATTTPAPTTARTTPRRTTTTLAPWQQPWPPTYPPGFPTWTLPGGR
ncbi:hypothetical protein [Nocardia asteroides]|uniref:hypothetical protein n=1 Tax=Nocardia asteroides TaxID=1824 RepID=UPI001E628DDB|nr:hypothetical protein [Nocardia asteroides]UGT59006.1 hypothetical protein LTT61_17035 [Nocardia asteroides]